MININSALFYLLLAGMVARPGFCAQPDSGTVRLGFDAASSVLSVTIEHPVGDRETRRHYVKKVEVAVDGDIVITQYLGMQADSRRQTLSYVLLDAAPGQEIRVNAECNRSGHIIKGVAMSVSGSSDETYTDLARCK